MPAAGRRITATRAYYPRVYPHQRAAAQGRVGKGGGRVGAGGIDTAPTGNIGGDFAKAIGAMIQRNRQDALANRLMNTAQAPRAGLVSPGVNPATGAANVMPTNVLQTGSAPITGGAGELEMRQQMQQQGLADQLQRAKIGAELALVQQRSGRGGGGGGGAGGVGGNAARWKAYLGGDQGAIGGAKGKAGKPAAYAPNSSTPDQPNYYNFNTQRADMDAQYGKGTYDRLLANAGNIHMDPKTGQYVSDNPDSVDVDPKTGDVTLKAAGGHAGAHIPYQDLQDNMARYDATLVQKGKNPRFSDQYLKTQNPQAGLPGGDAANPYTPANTLELNAVPPGRSFVNPKDGKVYQKQAPTQSPAQQTSQVDTGDQGQGLAGAPTAQGPDYTGGQPQVMPQAPIDLAAASGTNTPPQFDLASGTNATGGGLPADLQLADEIKRTQLANSLQGVA